MASGHEVKAVNRIATLVRRHPLLFAGRPFKIHGPFLGQGWLQIADEMCRDIEKILGGAAPRFQAIQSKEKWGSLRFYWDLKAAPGEAPGRTSPFEADIGGLTRPLQELTDDDQTVSPTPAGIRLSILPTGDLRRAVNTRVRAAEAATESTCMWCGAPGQLWTTGWIHVACPRHRRAGALTLEEWRRRRDEQLRKRGGDGDE